jgi:hypothetical protein
MWTNANKFALNLTWITATEFLHKHNRYMHNSKQCKMPTALVRNTINYMAKCYIHCHQYYQKPWTNATSPSSILSKTMDKCHISIFNLIKPIDKCHISLPQFNQAHEQMPQQLSPISLHTDDTTSVLSDLSKQTVDKCHT